MWKNLTFTLILLKLFLSGQLKCQLEDSRGNGVTHVKVLPGRVAVARIDGHLDFLDIVSVPGSADIGAHDARSRIRLMSTDSNESLTNYGDEIQLVRACSSRAHLQSISCMCVQSRKLITGSTDHTLRVFRWHHDTCFWTLASFRELYF